MIYILMLLTTAIIVNIYKAFSNSGKCIKFTMFDCQYELNQYFHIAIICLPMYLICALQYSIHSDYDNYVNIFYNIQRGFREMDPAYFWINKIIGQLNLNFQYVYLVVYGIAFFVLIKCLKNYSADIYLSILLFFTVFFDLIFFQIRQLVSVLICLYAYQFIANRKIWKYMFFVVIASTFHKSAIIMLPAYFLLIYEFPASYYLLGSGLFYGAGRFSHRFIPAILSRFMPQRLSWYQRFRASSINKWQILFLSLVLIIVCLYYKQLKNLDIINKKFLNGVFIYSILYCFGRWVPEVIRFGYYFYIPIIILLPNLISKEPNRYFRKILSFLLMFGGVFLFLINNYNRELFHYVSVFSAR